MISWSLQVLIVGFISVCISLPLKKQKSKVPFSESPRLDFCPQLSFCPYNLSFFFSRTPLPPLFPPSLSFFGEQLLKQGYSHLRDYTAGFAVLRETAKNSGAVREDQLRNMLKCGC